jgi:hypothetical protein
MESVNIMNESGTSDKGSHQGEGGLGERLTSYGHKNSFLRNVTEGHGLEERFSFM